MQIPEFHEPFRGAPLGRMLTSCRVPAAHSYNPGAEAGPVKATCEAITASLKFGVALTKWICPPNTVPAPRSLQ